MLRSIFQMGVPVSGKNLFPSNIAGLPTWFTIRANKNGYIARKKEIDLLVAMNPETAQDDVKSLAPGASVLFDQPLALDKLRDDLTFYSVPYDKLVAPVCPEAKLRKLVKNMIYVGVVAQLLEIDMAEVEKTVRRQFAKKVKAANLNLAAVKAGYDYAAANLTKSDPFVIARMNETQGKIIIDGNSAAALGCMFAGCTVVTWYPITPSSSLVETLIEYMKEHRIGPDGKATFAVVQAEDELAAIGMVIGAAWAGARSMTATAGPGISLMAEFTGLAYYVEIPAVIWDIQRVGTVDWPADAHFAGRHSLHRVSRSRRYQAPHAVSEFSGRVLHDGAGCVRSGRTISDAGVRHVGPRSGDEQLDGGSVQVSGEADQARQGSEQGRSGQARRFQLATRTWMATASAIALCRGRIIPRRRGSRAAAATTRRRSTASVRTTSSATWSASTRNSRRRDRSFRGRKWSRTASRRSASSPIGTSHWAITECRDQLRNEYKSKPTTCGCGRIRLRARCMTSSRSTNASMSSSRTAMRRWPSLLKLDIKAELTPRLRSICHIHGLPIDARSVTDELTTMEGK